MAGPSATRLRKQRPRAALVLVDDRDLRSAIVDLLSEIGWDAEVVTSYRAARDAILARRPGVLLVEPGLHVDLLERFVSGFEDRASVPGLVILSDLADAARVADEHDVAFVRAPFDLEDLSDALEWARCARVAAHASSR
ncbi:MAG: hypothetical protein HYV09_25685 [Deltaproteobacteria bacterium]|nr:hypothetical protein [Deltaproteobacteria bacterium]